MASGVHRGRTLFVARYGLPPWVCEMCGDPGADEVHHKDENRDNNEFSNLAGVHGLCHLRHHNVGRVDGKERRKKVSQGRKGKGLGPKTEEARANMNKARFGRKVGPETREKLRTSLKKRECSECGMISIPPAIGRHQKYTGHSGWVDLASEPETKETRYA